MILEIQINPCARGRGNASGQISNKNAENIELGKGRGKRLAAAGQTLARRVVSAAKPIWGGDAPKWSICQRAIANFAVSAVVAFGCLPLQSKPCQIA
jgi:hypothetical protein